MKFYRNAGLLAFVIPMILSATNTGKITGFITNAETGEPMIGVNVVIENTDLGAASDITGRYLILQVPPGTYTLVATAIGYERTRIPNLFVQTELTTTQDIPMRSDVLELEEVVVTAERPLVQQDMTSSRRNITSDDLVDMPVESIEDAVALTAGAVLDADGGLHFRGGRSQEVVYLFDGIPLNDPLTGNPNDSDVPVFSTEETSVISGGFGAEYGNAQSGVVNITSREGGEVFSGRLRYSTSNGISPLVVGEDPENLKRLEFSFGGPLLPKLLHFHTAGELSEDFGRFDNQHSDLRNYAGKLTLKLTDKIKLNLSGLISQADFDDGFDYDWSHTLSEDRLTEYIPGYVKQYDGSIDEIRDGILSEGEGGEAAAYYTEWWSTEGLQSEDIDGDGKLDIYFDTEPYADWNNNGQWDEGEWFEDVNGNGVYDAAIDYDLDGDGDRINEDINGNYSLDSEGFYDSWYGNGRLDTEDLNGNDKLDPGEDLNGNGKLDTEDVDRDGKLTTYRMFDRQPQWQTKSDLLSLEWRHTLSPRTYYTVRLSRYHTEQTSNVIERLNEDTDNDGVLDMFWATEPFEDLNGNNAWDEGEWYADLNKDGVYNYDLNWDVDGDGDKRNEDLNGNGVLDAYTPEKEVTTVDDNQDMFHDRNNNRYVDESERDWDGDGDIDEYDKRYFWIPWMVIPDEGFSHTTGGFYGVSSGHPYTFNRDHWHKDFKDVYMAQFDLLSQITDHHKFNTGFELSYYDMFNYWPPDRYSYAEKYHVNPIEWAAYLTNKMEYAGLVVNAGLRVQYFNPREQYPSPEPYVDENQNGEYDYGESFTDVDGDTKWDDGETDPTWSSEDYADWDGDGAPEYYKVREALAGNYIHEIDDHKNPKWAKIRWNIMPRLGVSHAITDKAMLYFNYGRYFQRPAMAYVFRNISYDMGGGYPIVGNPNLGPELSTSYEVGVRYEFLPGFLVEGKGFYKDIFGLTDTRPVFWTVSDWYTTYFNRDFGNTRGFELTLLRRPPGLITGEVNYTYSIAKGKASSLTQGYLTEWSGNIVPTFESYLDWDQTHMLVAHVNLNYHNFLTSLIFDYGSGRRYTRPGQGKLIVENTERYPSTLRSSLRMSYGFTVGKVKASAFLFVNNLLNLRNVLAAYNPGRVAYGAYSYLDDIQWYHTYKTLAEDYESGKISYNEYMTQVDLDHDGKIDQNKKYPERGAYLNPAVYSDIRRVQIGLSFRLN